MVIFLVNGISANEKTFIDSLSLPTWIYLRKHKNVIHFLPYFRGEVAQVPKIRTYLSYTVITRSQSISDHGTDLALLEYSGFSTRHPFN